VTAGLVHGLVSGRAFHNTKDVTRQQAFISRRYAGAVLSALALAIVAHPAVASLITSKYITAGILVVLSACMTSCMAFQFFQIPSMVAQTFDSKKAVCISWMDATAFFMNAPIWALVGHVVATQGWSMAFCIIAALFGLGGFIMTSTITPVLEKQQEDASG
jgi:MFS family permease